MSKRPSVIPAKEALDQLTGDVLSGLRKSPKELSPVWFYDELGSFLFDSICELPEYYVTRTEIGIMQTHAAEMAHHVGPHAALIEFGSGTSLKTRLLLDKLDTPAAYVPVDIAREHLLDAAATLARDYPALSIYPVCADFTQPFALPRKLTEASKRVVYFPGSTLGNFEVPEARRLLASMRNMIGDNGAVLIGIDLQKDSEVLQRAYDDAAGVTAEFNLNALRHINRELGTNFNLGAFEHCAIWVPEQGRIEMRLISGRDQTVDVGDEQVSFVRGEYIRTECCHKYSLEGFAELAASADLTVSRVWLDDEKKFSVQLLEPRALQ
ncbi:MAG TPA: L-histidine N(alpha)-methyltransferase [Steroidobacteraceae bacterium]|jgi:dimethylhistidine N-methyltransferase